MAKKRAMNIKVEVPPAEEAVPGTEESAARSAIGSESEPGAAEPDLARLLAEREEEVRKLGEQILYLHAEQENFKKRTEKRYREMLEYAAEPLLRDLLPVLENLERASAHAHEGGAEGFSALLEGLDHVITHFAETLSRHGVEAVPTDGVKFDPLVHEAMAQVPGEVEGQVADIYEKGYRFRARLLRPAKVTVTKVASGSGDD